MGLNIKNEETHRLARELARLTGESMSAAVNEAIRERLERVRGKSNDEMLKRIIRSRRNAVHAGKNRTVLLNIGDLLFDETGLPK